MLGHARVNGRQYVISLKVPVADAAQAGSTATTLKLAAADVQAANYYNGWYVCMTSGACVGQVVKVMDFDGADLTVYPAWVGGPPANLDTYMLFQVIKAEPEVFKCVAAGSTVSIVELADAQGVVSLDDWYDDLDLEIVGGTGFTGGQPVKRRIMNYVGATRLATLNFPLPVAPDDTTICKIQGHLYHAMHSFDAVAATAGAEIRWRTTKGGLALMPLHKSERLDAQNLPTSFSWLELGMDVAADNLQISRWE